MKKKPKKAASAPLKPGVVYVRPSGDAWDVLWLDGERIRSIRRRGKRQAEDWAARKQRELAGGGTEHEIPFGDTAQGLDGVAGNSWLELMWQAALTTAMNPGSGPEALQKASRTVAQLANAARKYIPQQAIGEEDANLDEWSRQFADEVISGKSEVAEHVLEALMDRIGAPTAQKAAALLLLQGGKEN